MPIHDHLLSVQRLADFSASDRRESGAVCPCLVTQNPVVASIGLVQSMANMATLQINKGVLRLSRVHLAFHYEQLSLNH